MAVRLAKPGEVKHVDASTAVTEYGSVGSLDAAEARIDGRYPEVGMNMNRESNMVVYVVAGSGTINTASESVDAKPGAVIHIDKQTPYFYEAQNLRIMMMCSPAWTPEQYEHVT